MKRQLTDILPADQIKKNEPMARHTSFKVGGPADFLLLPRTREELLQILEVLEDSPYYLMGKGTNLLVRDKGFRGYVIKTTGINQVTIDQERIRAQPGISLQDLAQLALGQSLTGLEFASGIPGSLGGGVTMNAGAYDGELKNVITGIQVIDPGGQITAIPASACHFAYRTSIVQQKGLVLLEVNLALRKGDYNQIKAKMLDLNERRWARQPLDYPSAGSTFRRPEGYFAGKLIADAGFKGFSIGGAQVSEKHSGFVINKGGATAADILALIKTIQEGVLKEFGVELQTEVIVIGEE